MTRLALIVVPLTLAACASAGTASGDGGAPQQSYYVFVAAEATDEIALVRFGPDGAAVERRHVTGLNRADPDGPHGLAVSPDRQFYYVSTAHGTPNGYLWKHRTTDDAVVGRIELGAFPASMQVSPDGHYVYVVNFNLHGEMVPSSVSIVAAAEMLEIARPTTCTMPHGSRFNPQGTKHYSTCMMDDVLVEIDTRTFAVARHFMLTPGSEHGMDGAPRRHATAGGDHGGHGTTPPSGTARCSPTWAAPSHDGTSIYVACNASNDIVEVAADSWQMTRRIAAGDGVYNLATTHDGRLIIATNKRGRSVSLLETSSGRELARIETTRPVVHGVAVSDDDRYAFISVEGIGSMPGTVEVIDLRALRRVAAVDVGQMAGGIDFWKRE